MIGNSFTSYNFVDAAEELVVVVLEELADLEVQVLWKVCFDAELLQSFEFVLKELRVRELQRGFHSWQSRLLSWT